MHPRSLATAIDNLRKSRLRPERDLSIDAALRAVSDDARRTARRLGDAGSAWADTCPPHILSRTLVEGLSRGVLTVIVADAPTRYELDRALREGLESALISRCRAPVHAVRLKLGDVPTDPAETPPPLPPMKKSPPGAPKPRRYRPKP